MSCGWLGNSLNLFLLLSRIYVSFILEKPLLLQCFIYLTTGNMTGARDFVCLHFQRRELKNKEEC